MSKKIKLPKNTIIPKELKELLKNTKKLTKKDIKELERAVKKSNKYSPFDDTLEYHASFA